jgi:hypothetical protein
MELKRKDDFKVFLEVGTEIEKALHDFGLVRYGDLQASSSRKIAAIIVERNGALLTKSFKNTLASGDFHFQVELACQGQMKTLESWVEEREYTPDLGIGRGFSGVDLTGPDIACDAMQAVLSDDFDTGIGNVQDNSKTLEISWKDAWNNIKPEMKIYILISLEAGENKNAMELVGNEYPDMAREYRETLLLIVRHKFIPFLERINAYITA